MMDVYNQLKELEAIKALAEKEKWATEILTQENNSANYWRSMLKELVEQDELLKEYKSTVKEDTKRSRFYSLVALLCVGLIFLGGLLYKFIPSKVTGLIGIIIGIASIVGFAYTVVYTDSCREERRQVLDKISNTEYNTSDLKNKLLNLMRHSTFIVELKDVEEFIKIVYTYYFKDESKNWAKYKRYFKLYDHLNAGKHKFNNLKFSLITFLSLSVVGILISLLYYPGSNNLTLPYIFLVLGFVVATALCLYRGGAIQYNYYKYTRNMVKNSMSSYNDKVDIGKFIYEEIGAEYYILKNIDKEKSTKWNIITGNKLFVGFNCAYDKDAPNRLEGYQISDKQVLTDYLDNIHNDLMKQYFPSVDDEVDQSQVEALEQKEQELTSKRNFEVRGLCAIIGVIMFSSSFYTRITGSYPFYVIAICIILSIITIVKDYKYDKKQKKIKFEIKNILAKEQEQHFDEEREWSDF